MFLPLKGERWALPAGLIFCLGRNKVLPASQGAHCHVHVNDLFDRGINKELMILRFRPTCFFTTEERMCSSAYGAVSIIDELVSLRFVSQRPAFYPRPVVFLLLRTQQKTKNLAASNCSLNLHSVVLFLPTFKNHNIN